MNKEKNKNITTKIVAVLIAIVMWSFVMSEVNPVDTREFSNIDVSLLNESSLQQAGLVLMEPKNAKISVKVTGRTNDINALKGSQIIAQADLWGYSEGSNKVPVEVKVPENIDIESISPKQIVFNFDSIVTREKTVVLKPIGNVEDGYSLGQGQVNPNTILIKGPRSLINSVSEVVASIDVTKMVKDIKTNVPIKVVDDKNNEVRSIEKEPSTVEVFLPVLSTKNVTIEPLIDGSPLDGYQIASLQANPRSVLIKGYEQDIKDITFLETEPIDIRYLTVDREIEIGLVLPKGVELVDSTAKLTAIVKIEKVVKKEFEYSVEEITFSNLKQQLAIDIPDSSEKIIITVKGIESVINGLDKEDIILFANLLDLEEGAHTVNIQVSKPDKVELVDAVPNSIHLTINKKL